MGRAKLKIKKFENTSGRQVTYSKRRAGILKKAKELLILCDIDIAILMFSPTGKPTLCLGERSTIEEVIAKFSQLTPQERAKRKLESLEALKKTFQKLGHDVNIQDFLATSTQTIEDMTNQSTLLQAQLSKMHKILSYWTHGRGTTLKDIPNVTYKLSRKKARIYETFKMHHLILFGRRGKAFHIKNNLLQFSGFVLHENEKRRKTDYAIMENKFEVSDESQEEECEEKDNDVLVESEDEAGVHSESKEKEDESEEETGETKFGETIVKG
ncbi:hypothetical protein GIB67_026510 [Kingdonia uniflora]|uniref:MADS-box domain-containing protein n=1 Tax=Kingdonia uniflora TaxID=39325 RepID=A0A7J7PBU9_9MAGN|nr:hypothetical protein GIB67_026510 [Kingdonia uniflora]